MKAIFTYLVAATMILFCVEGRAQTISGFTGNGKLNNVNLNYYNPLLTGSAKYNNSILSSGLLQQVADTSAVRDTTVAVFDIDSIPVQTIIFNYPSRFYIKSNALAAARKAVTGCKYYITSGKPLGKFSINRLQLFSYTTALDTLDFDVSFALYTASGDTVKSKNSVHFKVVPALQAENIAFGVASNPLLPSVTDKEFTVQTIDSTGPVNGFNFVNNQRLRKISYSGVKVIIEPNGSSHLDLLTGLLNLDSLNIYADTLIIRGRFNFPQTKISIYAKVLVFEDINGVQSSIGTTPGAGPANGLAGLTAGDIRLSILRIVANPGLRFILNGGNGENAPDPQSHIGAGGKGGTLYSTVDVSSFYVANGGFSGNVSYDPAVPYNGAKGKFIAIPNYEAAWLHPNFMYQLVNYYQERFFNGDTATTAHVFNEYRNWANLYTLNGKLNFLDTATAMQVKQAVQEMTLALYKINNRLDYYGNPVGWVPMLSFEVEASAYQNEANNAINTLYLDELIQSANSTLAQKQAAYKVYADSTKSVLNNANAKYHDLVFNQLPSATVKINSVQGTVSYLNQQLVGLNDFLNTKAQEIYDERHRSSIWGDILGGVSEVLSAVPSPYTQGAAVGITAGVQLFGSNADKRGFQQGSALAATIVNTVKPLASGALDSNGQVVSGALITGAAAILGQLGGGQPAGVNSNVANLFNQNKEAADNISQSITGIADLFNNVVSVNSDELGSIKGELIANEPRIGAIADQIQSVSDMQVQLSQQIQQMAADVIDSKNTIDNSLTSLGRFNQASVDAGAVVNHSLGVLSNDMRRKAFERLRLYYYYMAKAYEYRTLQPWTGHFITQGIVDNIDTLLQTSGNTPTITPAQVSAIKTIYTQTLDDIANSVITYYSNNTPSQGQLVKFNLNADEIKTLNAGNIVHLNLVERAGILFPSNENVRINNLSVVKTVIKQLPGQSANGPQGIVFNYPNQSKLRKDGKSYYFNNYSYLTKHPIFWETDVNLADNSLSNNIPSPSTTSLLNFLIGNNNANLQLFSTPAAWADIQLQLKQPINTTAKLDSATVQLQYEYTPTQSGKVNIVIKAQNKWFAPTFYINTPDVFNRRSGESGYIYRYYNQSPSSKVTVSAPATYGKYSFKRWVDDYGNPLVGSDIDTSGKNTIKFSLAHDLSLNAVYQFNAAVLNVPDTVYIGDSLNYKLHLQNTGTGPLNWLLDSSSNWVKYPVTLGVNDTTVTLSFDSNPDSVNKRTGVLDIVSLQTEQLHHYVYFVQNKGKGLVITSISPDTAITGNTVTIKGKYLKTKKANAVSFGVVNATSFKVVNDSTITAVVGGGASGIVTVGAPQRSASFAGFVFINAPLLTSFTPATAGQGAVVTITGKYLSTAKTITIGGNAVTSFSILSDSVITAVLASSTTGTVSVQTIGGTASLNGFSYCNPVLPSVTIALSPTGPICKETIVTFTATAVNGGNAPVYQWYKNNIAVGTNSKTYADGTLNNKDSIWCTITSNAPCYAAAPAKSNVVVSAITGRGTPSIAIAANVASPICINTPVTFTATIKLPGSKPVYQWFKNDTLVGTNAATYKDSTLKTGDSIYCMFTSNGFCLATNTAGSNAIYYTVNNLAAASVTVSASAPSYTAKGNKITFTATPVNVAVPVYQWYKNSQAAGTNSNTYVDSTLKNNDSIWCTVTSANACFIPNPAKSNTIVTVFPSVSNFSPATGAVGTLVTISGSNLNNITSLSIGGVPAVIISSSGGQAVAMVMPGAVTGNVIVGSGIGYGISAAKFTVTPTPVPMAQQGNKLTGAGAAGQFTYQGYAVAVSADGNTAVVGAPQDSSGYGAAYIYTRNNGVWAQQGAKLVGTTSTGNTYIQQGQSVAISADGNTVLIGGPYDNSGAAWVFTRNGSAWAQQGSKLTGLGQMFSGSFGFSVALSADGNTAVIGSPADSNFTGAMFIFNRVNNAWSQTGNKLAGAGAYALYTTYFGYSVAISADAKTIVAGGYFDSLRNGATWVFTNNNGVWVQQGNKLLANDELGLARQGTSVAISADGNTLITGGTRDNGDNNNGIGAAWVFTRNNGVWQQQGNKLVGSDVAGANIWQGSGVGLSADGNTAVVGGPFDNSGAGAFWMFKRTSGVWAPQGGKLMGTGVQGLAGQGKAVAISADGSTAFAGGYTDGNDAGGAAWAFVQKLPVINSFNPKQATAGDNVNLRGINFTGATSVSFGGVNAASFIVKADTLISAKAGFGSSGDVVVTTPFGTATKSGFTYVSPYTPPGTALVLNGVNNTVNINTATASLSNAFTVEAWVRPLDTVNVLNILSGTSNTGPAFEMKLSGGNTIHGSIGDGATVIVPNADATFKYTAGVWCHIAYVVSPTGYTIYANDDSVGGGNFTGAPLLYNAMHNINIGSLTGVSGFFNGSIDELRIYDTILSKTSIQADMRNIAIAIPAHLKLYYNFDQPTGSTTVTDFSGNNYTGTIAGTAPYNFVESYAMVLPKSSLPTNITGSSFTASWAAATTGVTDNYLLDVSTDGAFTAFVAGYHQLPVNGLSQTVTGLKPAKKYFFRVRSVKASVPGQGAYSARIAATTASSLTATPAISAGIYNQGAAYLKVYPNPVKTTAIVEFGAETESKYEAQLINAIGQVITAKSGITAKGANIIVFDMNGIATGLYYVRLLNKGHGAGIVKFTKVK